MRQLVVRGLSGQSACISLASCECSVEDVQEKIFSSVGVPPEQQKLVIGGKLLTQDVLDSVSASDVIFVSLSVRVLGGKGGFGSLLRGGQSGVGAKKITNFGSMRDLQGRRIKDVEKAKRIAKAIAKQNGEEVSSDDEGEDPNPRRRRRKVLRKKLRPGQEQNEQQEQQKPVTIADLAEVKYSQTRKEILDNVASAMEEGLKRAKQLEKEERRRKRKQAKAQPAKIFGFDLEEELLSSSDEEDDDKDGNQQKKEGEAAGEDSEYEWVSESYSGSDDEEDGEENVEDLDAPQGDDDNDGQDSPSRGLKRSRPDDAEGDDTNVQTDNGKVEEDAVAVAGSSNTDTSAKQVSFDPIDLSKYASAKDLESVGLDHLKHELQRLNLLCGGNLSQRAERLFSTKNKSPAEFDPSILASNASKKRKK